MTENKAKIAVFISGGGSNLQALIDASKAGILSGQVVLVISSKQKAFGLERAKKENIPTFVFKPKSYDSVDSAADDLFDRLKDAGVEYIATAGYLQLLPEKVVRAYRNRIVNIHPALLPKFGGKGMYGHHVHEAVLAAGEKVSGPTVHLVDEIYDNGKILEQIEVPVLPDDTPDSLAERVLKQEHRLFPRVMEKLIKGKYEI